MFKALVVDNSSGVVAASVRDLDEASLPPGNVTVAVEYSGINYKDGLVATGAGGLVKRYPHVPGIDSQAAYSRAVTLLTSPATRSCSPDGAWAKCNGVASRRRRR